MLDDLQQILFLGGPVVAALAAVSVLTLAVILYKIWHMAAARVGQHKALRDAVDLWDSGDVDGAEARLGQSQSYLAPVIAQAMRAAPAADLRARLEAEAETRFQALESGFRLLDSVAQLAPLLGLFGTVLGMIEAFQALQAAGSAVDPSLLAGGIWVALLTTALGLGIAMPTSLVLAWLDGRMARERVFADTALATILAPARPRHAS